MPKYMIEASYTVDGLKGVQKDKATGRRKAVAESVSALGGRLESYHYALGKHDVVAIVDLPDMVTITALAFAISATGLARTRTTALLTAEEVDQALQKSIAYRGPGR